jgi:SAM-dependent methyltransferase
MSALFVQAPDKEITVVDTKARGEVHCPVCDSACTTPPLYRYTVEQAAAHFCPPTRSTERNRRLRDCIARLWEESDCLILRCDQCGFGFAHPFVGGDEEFYGILHEQKGYPAWRWDYDVAVTEAIDKFTGGKVLDIGAGVGNFLRRLNETWECYAVEGSDLTRCDLEASRIRVFRNLEDATNSHAGTFQVVTLFQVLEHIAEFDFVLKQCRKLLAPGGRLVVTVPEGEAMIRQERVTGCADMPPNHLGKWTPSSLCRVLTRIGFECSDAIPEPPSLNSLRANLHMRVSADVADDKSISAQAYRVRNKPVRIVALSLLAVPALLRLLPFGRQLVAGGAFAIVAVPRR